MTPKALDLASFNLFYKKDNVLIVDTRHQTQFVSGHIPNALFLGIDGPFEIWSKILLLNTQNQIILVCEVDREKDIINKLESFGITTVLGFLKGGIETYAKSNKELATIKSITPIVFKKELKSIPIVFDVRKKNEYENSHLKSAKHTPLNNLKDYIEHFPKNKPFYVFCGGGYRSVITASILKSIGCNNPIDVKGGFKSFKEAGIKIIANK